MLNKQEDEVEDYPTTNHFQQSRGTTPMGIMGAINAANFGYASRSKAIYTRDSNSRHGSVNRKSVNIPATRFKPDNYDTMSKSSYQSNSRLSVAALRKKRMQSSNNLNVKKERFNEDFDSKSVGKQS